MDSRAKKDPSPIVPDVVTDIETQKTAGTEEENALKPAKGPSKRGSTPTKAVGPTEETTVVLTEEAAVDPTEEVVVGLSGD